MTTQLRAHIRKARHPAYADAPWLIDITTPGPHSRLVLHEAPSWPEAMQQAYLLLRDLDRELMDQVHASRATRRTPAPIPASTHINHQEATA